LRPFFCGYYPLFAKKGVKDTRISVKILVKTPKMGKKAIFGVPGPKGPFSGPGGRGFYINPSRRGPAVPQGVPP